MATSVPNLASCDHDRSVISPRLFTVAEYHKLAEAGVLSELDRVELIDGVISQKMIHSPIHDAIVSWIEQQLRPRLLPDWFFRIQSSVTLGDASEPEPDLAVVRGSPLMYMQQHPRGTDVAMVVEVAETSLGRDRYKATGYASAGIPLYWIVNLPQRQIECFRSPHGNAYREVTVLQHSDDVELGLGFVDAAGLKVRGLLPLDGETQP